MVFCVSWQFFRKFSSHSTRQDLKYLFCLLHKSTLDLCSFFFSFIWEPQCIGCCICYLMVMTELSPLLFSVFAETGGKKLRSTVQRSTETGLAVEMRNWMTRQASRESTDGSMNSYSSEGKWVMLAEQWSPPCLAAVFLLSLSLSAFTEANSHAPGHSFNLHWLICCEENFCLPATEKCDMPGFLYQWT